MVAVNEAFHFVHALLRERDMGTGIAVNEDAATVGETEVRDCAAYRYKCGEMLFLVALDDWNVDTAFTWLERVSSGPWQQSSYAHHPWRRIALTEPAGELASRLWQVGLREQASRALDVARSGLREAENHRLNYGRCVRVAEDIFAGRRRAQVVIKHRRQADNALRLGVIDANRHQTIMKRLASSAAADEIYEERLCQFQAGGGFLRDLPTDNNTRGKVPQRCLVPEPGYYVTRIEQLTHDQQAEYLLAFSDRGTLPLVRKYTFVRLVSLLESVLFHPGHLDDGATEREARALASFHGASGDYYASEVADVVAELRQQPLSERQARAKLLKDIGERTGRAMLGVSVTLTFGDVSPLGMALTPEYFKLMRLHIDDLRTMQRTGRLPESEEERGDREARNRDLAALRTPEVKAAHEAASAAIDVANANPEAAVQQFRRYCNLLLALGRSMINVQELQLGFWVDRLTAALLRLNCWREALEWLERYFALPPRYRGRSSSSEENSLRKRLARCAKVLGKGAGTR